MLELQKIESKDRVMALDPAVIGQLKSQLRGQVNTPGDGGYEEARKVYNGMIDKRPDHLLC